MWPPPLRLAPKSVKMLPRTMRPSPSRLTDWGVVLPPLIMTRDMEAESPVMTPRTGVASASAGRALIPKIAANKGERIDPSSPGARRHRGSAASTLTSSERERLKTFFREANPEFRENQPSQHFAHIRCRRKVLFLGGSTVGLPRFARQGQRAGVVQWRGALMTYERAGVITGMGAVTP